MIDIIFLFITLRCFYVTFVLSSQNLIVSEMRLRFLSTSVTLTFTC